MVMDYWCSLWFWDMRNAEFLPSRQQYLNDVSSILNVNLSPDTSEQLGFGFEESTLRLAQSQIIHKTEQSDLFDEKERLSIVKDLSIQNRFFHSQLEFVEVFLERGGFDVIVGNPPWIKLSFNEVEILGEYFPEIIIKKYSAPEVSSMIKSGIINNEIRVSYSQEQISNESINSFLTSKNNYFLLNKLQPNLYKCIIDNSFKLLRNSGFCGLIHPESTLDDPKGGVLRKEIYKRYLYHFQFQNELKLFPIGNRETYGIHIYGDESEIDFFSISTLFHPSTIENCFLLDDKKVYGIKIKSESDSEFKWNTKGYASRLIHVTEETLDIFNQTFDHNSLVDQTKLPSIFSSKIISVLKSFGSQDVLMSELSTIITRCWDESGAVKKKIIRRETKFPNYSENELVLNGPHFYVSNPLYQTPKRVCNTHKAYDFIDLTKKHNDFLPRTNYLPDINFNNEILSKKGFDQNELWINYYKCVCSKRISISGERTLQSSIIPPKITHVDTIISLAFKERIQLIVFTGITSSICYDFLVKTIGRGDFTNNTIESLPYIKNLESIDVFKLRVLQLNCISYEYSDLWRDSWSERFTKLSWSKSDLRLSNNENIGEEWNQNYCLRNQFERRQALVEIDVMAALGLGLSLEELELIYKIQFPVLQQNEEDTWYDQKGNIVFTCSKGLTGVGVDRSVWNSIKDLKDGETYEHTIGKSELYYGEKVIYYAPFEKCDRVEDYKVAWAHFEKIFNQN